VTSMNCLSARPFQGQRTNRKVYRMNSPNVAVGVEELTDDTDD